MERSPTAPLRRLWRYAEPSRWRIVRAVTWSILNKAMDIAPPFLIGLAIDIVVNEEASFIGRLGIDDPKDQLAVLAVVTFAVWALESVFEYLAGIAWRNLAQQLQHDLRVDTYDNLQHLDVSYFEGRSSGDLMAVLNDDVNQLERFLDVGADDLVQMATTVVLIGATFFWIAASVAWLAFLPMPVIIVGSLYFQRWLKPRYVRVREQAAAINAQLANNLGGIATIKAYTAEDEEVVRVAAESERYRLANREAIKLSELFSPLIRVAILVGFTATLVWGGFLAIDGRLDVGLYSVMVFLTQRLLWPLTSLGETLDLYQRAMASAARILGVLDTEPQMGDGDRSLDPGSVAGVLALEDVTFAYQPGHPVLHQVTLEIPAGETTAFVGATGSGKTTIVKLLLRFYDPEAGTVTLDGVDIRSLRQRQLRSMMALVSQDVFLFHGTVAENIRYGRSDASFDEIVAAADLAEADEFIRSLPDGYDTIVGERGQRLSGGQRQRVSIARALLSRAPILLLDEATSAVDNETEAAIQRSLARVAHQRTMVVIAHRLSTIRHADRIYVVDRGRIVEQGSHEDLVDHAGIYRSLWLVQTGEAV